MINVSAIPNYNNQISFSGKFMKSSALDKAIEKADVDNLFKFDELLKRMYKNNDGRIFELYSIIENNYGRSLHTVNFKEFKLRSNSNAIENARITQMRNREYEVPAYKGLLAKINQMLEKIYPEKPSENISANELIESISKYLS